MTKICSDKMGTDCSQSLRYANACLQPPCNAWTRILSVFFKYIFPFYAFPRFQIILCNNYNNCKCFLFTIIICVCVCVCTFMNVHESTCHGILAEVREPLARVGCILASQESLVLTTDHRPWHRVRLLTEPPHLPLRWSWFSVHSLRGIFMNVSYSSLCELFKLASPKLLRALQNCWGLCCFCFLEEEVVRSTDNCTGR